MIELTDKRTGERVDVSSEELQSAMESGNYSFPPGSTVAMVRSDGTAGTVPSDQIQTALAKGFKFEDEGATHERVMEHTYGSAPITSALEGAARGLSFGISDWMLAKGGYTSEEAIRERMQRNPVAAVGGEIVGALAPALLTGGSSAAGSAAATGARGALAAAAELAPTARIAALGEAVGGAVRGTKVISGLAGRGLLSRVAARAVPLAAQGATEGALYGAASSVTKLALSDDPITVESALSTIGNDMLLGATLGGASGAVGSLMRDSVVATRNAARNVAEKFSAKGQVGGDLLEALRKGPAKPDRATRKLLEDEKKAIASAIGEERMALENATELAKHQTTAGVQELGTATEKLKNDLITIEKKSRSLRRQSIGVPGGLEENPELARRLAELDKASADMREAFGMKVEKTPEIGKRGKPLMKGGVPKTKNAYTFDLTDDQIRAAVQENPGILAIAENQKKKWWELVKATNPDTALKQLEDVFPDSVEEFAGILNRNGDAYKRLHDLGKPVSSEKLTELTGRLENLEAALAKSPHEHQVKLLGDFVDMAEKGGFKIEDSQILKFAEEGGMPLPEMPAKGSPEYLAIKANAIKAAAKQQLSARRGVGLAGGLADAATGALIGVATDYILDGAIGNVMGGGIIGGLAGRFMRGKARGGIMSSISTFQKIAAKGAGMIERGLTQMLKSPTLKRSVFVAPVKILNGVRYSKEGKQHGTLAEAYKARTGELAELAANPDQALMTIREKFEGIRGINPSLADKLEQAAMRRIEFLHSKIPPAPRIGTLQDGFSKYQPSEALQAKFAKYIRASENPATVVEDMQAGRLSLESVETLQAVYPEIYGQMRSFLVTEIPKMKRQLLRQERMQLSLFFGVPVDSAMRPENVAASQANFQEQESGITQGRNIGKLQAPEPTRAQSFTGGRNR